MPFGINKDNFSKFVNHRKDAAYVSNDLKTQSTDELSKTKKVGGLFSKLIKAVSTRLFSNSSAKISPESPSISTRSISSESLVSFSSISTNATDRSNEGLQEFKKSADFKSSIARDVKRNIDKTSIKLENGDILRPDYSNSSTICDFFEKIQCEGFPSKEELDSKDLDGKKEIVQNFIEGLEEDSPSIKILQMLSQSNQADFEIDFQMSTMPGLQEANLFTSGERNSSYQLDLSTPGQLEVRAELHQKIQDKDLNEYGTVIRDTSVTLDLKDNVIIDTHVSHNTTLNDDALAEKFDSIKTLFKTVGDVKTLKEAQQHSAESSRVTNSITLTNADRARFKDAFSFPKPRLTLSGIKRSLSNLKMKWFNKTDYTYRKITKLKQTVESFEESSWNQGVGQGDLAQTKAKFKAFILEEANRYVANGIEDDGLKQLVQELFDRVNLISKEQDGLGVEFREHEMGEDITFDQSDGSKRTYSIGHVFAAGSSGTVRTCKLTTTHSDGTTLERNVVVKEMYLQLKGQEVPRMVSGAEAGLEILNERDLRLEDGSNHPRLAQSLDAVVTQSDDDMIRLNIFMEKLEDSGEKIAEQLQSKSISDRSIQTQTMLSQVSEGLDFMHSKGIMHRDLKPANIAQRDDGNYVILDFGAAGRVTGTPPDTVETVGSEFFRAPEVLSASLESPYTTKADIFSLGVTAYQMIAGTQTAPALVDHLAAHPDGGPVEDVDSLEAQFNSDQLDRAFQAEPWSSVDTKLKELIQKMLDPNPDNRPTAAEVRLATLS